MKVGVVLLSAHNARSEVLSVISLPRLIIMNSAEEEKFFNDEFTRIKNNFLGTLSDRSGVDIYFRIYEGAETTKEIGDAIEKKEPLTHHSV